MSTTNLGNLPPELLSHICAHLDQSDLLRVASLCRVVSPAALRQLHLHPIVHSWEIFHDSMANRPYLQKLVKRVHWKHPVDEDLQAYSSEESAPTIGTHRSPIRLENCLSLHIALDGSGAMNDLGLDEILVFIDIICPYVFELSVDNLSLLGSLPTQPSKIRRLSLWNYVCSAGCTGLLLQHFPALSHLDFGIADDYLEDVELEAICSVSGLQALRIQVPYVEGPRDTARAGRGFASLQKLQSLRLEASNVEPAILRGPLPCLIFMQLQTYDNGDNFMYLLSQLATMANADYWPALRKLELSSCLPRGVCSEDPTYHRLLAWAQRNDIYFRYTEL